MLFLAKSLFEDKKQQHEMPHGNAILRLSAHYSTSEQYQFHLAASACLQSWNKAVYYSHSQILSDQACAI